MDIDKQGAFLESMGLSDEQIDVYFEHHGVAGMKWGVRRNRRANNLVQVGKGKASGTQKLRALANYTALDLVKGRGLKKASRIRGERQLARNKRVKNGESSVRDKIAFYGGTKYQDIFPTGKKSTNTHAALGASIAGAMVVSLVAGKVARSVATG